MHIVYIALGSNLGEKTENIRTALTLMRGIGIKVTHVAGLIETPPYGKTDQPDFTNTVCRAETDFTPQELLFRLHGIEEAMGRVRKERWGPRVIDLDILLYDDLVLKEERLTIPHADMLNRRFVLGPLAEISPGLLHPVSGRTIKEQLELINRLE